MRGIHSGGALNTPATLPESRRSPPYDRRQSLLYPIMFVGFP